MSVSLVSSSEQLTSNIVFAYCWSTRHKAYYRQAHRRDTIATMPIWVSCLNTREMPDGHDENQWLLPTTRLQNQLVVEGRCLPETTHRTLTTEAVTSATPIRLEPGFDRYDRRFSAMEIILQVAPHKMAKEDGKSMAFANNQTPKSACRWRCFTFLNHLQH